MRIYQVRKDADASKPEDRGVLVAEYETYREAFRHWQQLNVQGVAAFVVVVY